MVSIHLMALLLAALFAAFSRMYLQFQLHSVGFECMSIHDLDFFPL